MAKTHWKKLTNPDYLGAWALEEGQEMIVTIKSIGQELVPTQSGGQEEKTVMHFESGVKPLILNKTNFKALEKACGSPYIEDWAGKNIQLYSDKVTAFGTITDALRIRDFAPQEG